MTTSRQTIREQISPFDAKTTPTATTTSTSEDHRTADFMAKLRARTDALDAVEPKQPPPKKPSRRRAAAPPATPSWYQPQPIDAPKPSDPVAKRFVSPNPYPGRRHNKPKAD